MRTTLSRSAVAATFTTLVFAVSACGSSGGATGGTNESTTSEVTSPLTSQPAGPALASMDPCQMLTPDEAVQFAVEGPGEPDEIMGSRGCNWEPKDGYLSVAFHEDKSIDELNFSDGEQQPYDLAGRKAKIARGNTGDSCTIAITVSESESVTVDAGGVDDIATSCAMAKKAAPMVEAKLPGN